MKRSVNFILIISFLLLVSSVQAQERGALTNVWASWVNVTTSVTTLTFPFKSRDLTILNGSTTDICVSLTGDTLTDNSDPDDGQCYGVSRIDAIQIDGATELYLSDFITQSVSIRAISGTASPVSVVVTY